MNPDEADRRAARALLHDLITHSAVTDANEPHAVIMRDPETGSLLVYGPFDNALLAVEAAEAWRGYHDEKTGPPAMEFRLAMFCGPETPPKGEGR